jgi:predicted AAA+ superfamily ATPase
MLNRKIESEIENKIENNKILVVEGANGVGKTTLARKFQSKKIDAGEIVEFVEVEKERYSKKLENASNFIQYMKRNYSDTPSDKTIYLFLDNTHYLDNGVNFLLKIKKELDLEVKIIAVTSSGDYKKTSEYQSNEEKFSIVDVYSLTWQEFLEVQTGSAFDTKIGINKENKEEIGSFYKDNQEIFRNYFDDLLLWGSYPQIIKCEGGENKRKIIEKIFLDTIETEAAEKIQKSNMEKYLKFLQVMARSSTYSINHNRLSNQIRIHKRTLQKFIDLTENLFLFSFVKPFYRDESNEITKMTKVFGNDFGIINYLAGHSPVTRLPTVYEKEYISDFIFDELCRHEDTGAVKFYRTIAKAEIDFVTETEAGLVPVELNFLENKCKSSVVLNNFEERYSEDHHKSLIITRDKVKIEENKNKVYLPAAMLSFVKLIN